MSLETLPKNLKGLRACLMCSLIKSTDQFEKNGCENCDSYLRIKGNIDNVLDCTSKNFDGMIGVMSPQDSWVAKWQRNASMCPGMYAISVSGRLPASIVRDLKTHGIPYRSRDTSQK